MDLNVRKIDQKWTKIGLRMDKERVRNGEKWTKNGAKIMDKKWTKSRLKMDQKQTKNGSKMDKK